MKDECVRVSAGRRRWLVHCTALVAALVDARAFAQAQAQAQAKTPAPAHAPTTRPPPKPSGTAVVLVLGDSLSAEYGLARGSGWVALLARRLADRHDAAQVVNASVSGETTSGGLSRLPALLAQHRPAIVVIELGGNDGLRGLPVPGTQANLLAMAKAAKATGAQVVIVGMRLPANFGRDYDDRFAAMFAAVATQTQSHVVPFLLAGVADRPDAAALFQDDRIHPKAAAHPRMLDNVWAVLGPLLPKARAA